MNHLPLADVRVLDVADHVGEAAARLLADLGADVIKVEPLGGAATRNVRRVAGVGLQYAMANANKRHGSADFADPAGLEQLRTLAAAADIVVLGGAEADAIDPDQLSRNNPHLVVLISTPYGRTGPRSSWVATDQTLVALSGVLSRSGRPGQAPLLPPEGIATATAATSAAWHALIALIAVRNGRPGQIVDLSHHEAVVTGLDPGFGVQGSAAAGRSGKVRRDRPPADSYPIYRCRDGHVRISLLAKRQWRNMREWLGNPAELSDPRLDSIAERAKSGSLISELIGGFFADAKADDLVAEAAERGVPLARVLTVGDAIVADHFVTAGTVSETELAPGIRAQVPVGCIDFDGERLQIRTATPFEPQAGIPRWRDRLGRRARADAPPNAGPFAGLRVLDLGVIVFGAEIGRAFADLGADVIKVENSAFPDGLRQTRGGEAMNASFAWGQRNKRSFGLDLRSDRGREIFIKLAQMSDVVLSNFKPGTLDSLQIGYDVLREHNRSIVVMESAAYSSRGPWAPRLGYGPLVRAACGITSLWKYHADDVDSADGITVYPDHVAGRIGALAVAAAVLRARCTGAGARIELAQSDVVLHQLAALAAHESLQPGSASAVGNNGRLFACDGDDEWCVIDPITSTQAQTVQGVLGDGETLESWARRRSPQEAMNELQAVGVPAGAMLRIPELLDDPQLTARGTYTRFKHSLMDHPLPTECSDAPYGLDMDLPLKQAPLAGEHTREIAQDVLGMDEATVKQLLVEGVIHESSQP